MQYREACVHARMHVCVCVRVCACTHLRGTMYHQESVALGSDLVKTVHNTCLTRWPTDLVSAISEGHRP